MKENHQVERPRGCPCVRGPRDITKAPPSMLINEISKLFNDRMRKKTEALGMAEGWRRIIFHLRRNDSLTQLELVHRTHLSAPAISNALQKMEADGLVHRRQDPQDQRAILVSLTDAGLEADRKILGAIHETEAELLGNISPEALAAVRPVLEKMFHNLKEKCEE